MKKKNYPLYETTIFEDFRIMTENAAKRFPERTAVSYKTDPRDTETVKVTFKQARDRIRNLGTAMIASGARYKHAAIIGESSYDWICAYFALMAIESVTVPIDKDLHAEEMLNFLTLGECEIVFYSPDAEEKILSIQERLPEVKLYVCMGDSKSGSSKNLDDIAKKGEELFSSGDNSYYDHDIDTKRMATIVFTSGTTGKGKGVMLSQENIVSDMTNGMYFFQITPKTIMVLPPHHTFGSTVNFVGHFSQGSEVYISSGLRYIASEIKEQQPTHLVLVPLFIEKLYDKVWKGAKDSGKDKILKILLGLSNVMLKLGIDLRRKLFKSVLENFGGKLELIICGGAPLNQKIIDFFTSIGITILNGYGITECSPLISCNRNEYTKRGSVGQPIMHEEVKIKDPDINGEGEICVKGPNVMLGYYKNPEATKEVFDEEGFFKTGDFGRLDDEGWLYITGRIKNIIILSNGKNVYPEEIENKLSIIPGISEVVVYSGESRSNKKKEAIVAQIFADKEFLNAEGISDPQRYFEEEVRKINEQTLPYKAVTHVILRDEEFVKNTSRKILRFKIDKTID